MDQRAKAGLILSIFSLSLLFSPLNIGGVPVASAASQGELNQRLNQLNTEMNSLKNQLQQKRNEKSTLQNEIAIFEGQIKEIVFKIEATAVEIQLTQEDIAKTNEEIKSTKKEIAGQKVLLRENIKILYEEGSVSVAEVVASSEDFSSYLDRAEYLVRIQDKIQVSLKKIDALKKELEGKRKRLEERKQNLAKLQHQQNGQYIDLGNQKAQKDALLAKTNGEEANYQNVLNEKAAAYRAADAELKSILSRPSPNVSGGFFRAAPAYGSVKKGTVIGYQGNTGFSSGSHLHFGVYIGDRDVDPTGYLNSGQISYPLDNFTITQSYWGSFSHRGVGWPGGLDMVSYYGAPIKAAADGNIIFNGYMANGFGHYIIMEHGNGLRTLYGHMQ